MFMLKYVYEILIYMENCKIYECIAITNNKENLCEIK